MVFPAELQDGNRQAPGEKRKSDPKVKKHGVPGKRRLPKVGGKPAQATVKPRAGEPNKRQQLEALLTGTGPDTGHTWVEGHRSRDNLCIKCSTCGFFVEQVDSRVSFDKCATLASGGNHRLPKWGSTHLTKWLMVAKCGYAADVAYDNG